jgi:TrmH family RNA methyltransferase
VEIVSPSNQLVRQVGALQRRKARASTGLTVIEGFQILRMAVLGGRDPRHVLYFPPLMEQEDWSVLSEARSLGARCIEISSQVLKKLSLREGPLACIATVPIVRRRIDELTVSSSGLLLVAEQLEKPGNLGALVRTASAAGVEAVIVADARTDVYSPACVHASLGAVFVAAVAEATSAESVSWLSATGVSIVPATPAGTRLYDEVEMTGPVAIVVGNEHQGVDPMWLAAGHGARIPMEGPMNSLNATMAGGIMLFEAVRQRRAASREHARSDSSSRTTDVWIPVRADRESARGL